MRRALTTALVAVFALPPVALALVTAWRVGVVTVAGTDDTVHQCFTSVLRDGLVLLQILPINGLYYTEADGGTLVMLYFIPLMLAGLVGYPTYVWISNEMEKSTWTMVRKFFQNRSH